MKQRKMMSNSERSVLLANVELVRREKLFKKDIITLIGYIKGNKQLYKEVEGIINYYTTMNQLPKYDRSFNNERGIGNCEVKE